jgi:hypothetical protein
MANPVSIALTADVWTAVATNVAVGRVRLGNSSGKYLYTYRETGGAAPTHENDNGLADIVHSNYLEISHSTPVDTYMRHFDTNTNVVVML